MKTLSINISDLKSSALDISDFSLLQLLYLKQAKYVKFLMPDYMCKERLILLEEDGWCKINNLKELDVTIRQKFIDCLTTEENDGVELWIDEYRNLFRGKKISSMGDKVSCLDKMRRFVLTYPEYTKDEILAATRFYIESQAPFYKFLRRADYFIFKKEKYEDDGSEVSILLNILEEMNGKEYTANKDLTKEI